MNYIFKIKNNKIITLICVVLVILLCFFTKEYVFVKIGYIDVNKVMKMCDYDKIDNMTWSKEKNNVSITVKFDMDNNKCMKNKYEFILNNPVKLNNNIYITIDDCEEILNVNVQNGFLGQYSVKEQKYNDWIDTVGIMHAGGAVRKDLQVYFYTNSQEALVQNYSLGARVFEFDFFPTSDDNLAVVHDWDEFGSFDGTPYTTEEWLNSKTGGMNDTNLQFTTMDIGVLLDNMIVNPDLFIVTDTKSFSLTDDETRREFEIIRDEALKRDSELLSRIIPQIYDFDMYNIVKDVYDFPNMIFTCYISTAEGDDIVDFCTVHKEFKAITAPYGDSRFDFDTVEKLKSNNLKLYYHTIYDYNTLIGSYMLGADGVYSGIYTPRDIREIMNFSK